MGSGATAAGAGLKEPAVWWDDAHMAAMASAPAWRPYDAGGEAAGVVWAEVEVELAARQEAMTVPMDMSASDSSWSRDRAACGAGEEQHRLMMLP